MPMRGHINYYSLWLGLLITREINLSRVLGHGTGNNFMDILIAPAHISLAVFIYYRRQQIPGWAWAAAAYGLMNILLRGGSLPHGVLSSLVLLSWATLIGPIIRRGWWLAAIPFALFDHVLLSSPFPVLIAAALSEHAKLAAPPWPKVSYLVLLLHSLVALLQTLTGSSVGLYIIGEKYLDLTTPGIAKTEAFLQVVLRGYGLFAHPSVLGFMGVLALLTYKQKKLRLLGLFAALIAQSRAALLALLLSLPKRLYWVMVVPALVLTALRITTSDLYRYQDAQHFVQFVRTSPASILLGTGPGNYQFALEPALDLPLFQYQPVHSAPLLLLVEYGAVPLMLLWYYWRRPVAAAS